MILRERVGIVPAEVGEECIVLRRVLTRRLSIFLYDDSSDDPSRFYPLVSVLMAEDNANDPSLESYQKYKR